MNGNPPSRWTFLRNQLDKHVFRRDKKVRSVSSLISNLWDLVVQNNEPSLLHKDEELILILDHPMLTCIPFVEYLGQVNVALRTISDESVLTAQQRQKLIIRGWKLMAVSLEHPESFVRYQSLEILNNTLIHLNDLSNAYLRKELSLLLMDMSVSDERVENRTRAIFMLGRYVESLGIDILDGDREVLDAVFKHLAKLILKGQKSLKDEPTDNLDITDASNNLKPNLIKSMAKFTNCMTLTKEQENLVLYLINGEFLQIFSTSSTATSSDSNAPVESNTPLETMIPSQNDPAGTMPTIKPSNPDMFILLALLDLLNGNVMELLMLDSNSEIRCSV